eukprot:804603_1
MSQFTLVRCGTLQTINLFPSGVLPAFDEVVNNYAQSNFCELLGAVESDKVVWVRPLCHNDNCLCHNEVDVPIDMGWTAEPTKCRGYWCLSCDKTERIHRIPSIKWMTLRKAFCVSYCVVILVAKALQLSV